MPATTPIDSDATTSGTQDRLGLMFFLVMYLSLMALSSLPIWRDEQHLFVHERAAGAFRADDARARPLSLRRG